jgi:hypothetical protein
MQSTPAYHTRISSTPYFYTARDSKIGSANVEQPLHLRPVCIDKLFKFICFKRRLCLAQIQGVSLASPNF